MSHAYHGGGFWDEIGPSFPPGFAHTGVINADVLDAWFPPAPSVIEALKSYPEWLAKTSPPTHAEGLVSTIARVRDIPEESILVGAGSSALIYLVWRQWVTEGSRVLLQEPMYGEYRHLAENVSRSEVHYAPELEPYDLAVIVNPNNPTGEAIPALQQMESLPMANRILIDEAYVDYLGSGYSVEREAAKSKNLFVVKSLSKGLALSGMRVAYIVGPPGEIARLKRWSPPWAVGTMAQMAAIRGLESPEYYAVVYRETLEMRDRFVAEFVRRGFNVKPGINWIMIQVEDAEAFCQKCRSKSIYVRNAGLTAPSLGNQWVRIAVLAPAIEMEFWRRFESYDG